MAKKKSKEYEIALREYRQLARVADRRLRNLENLSKQDGFKGVKRYAYARAMRDIEQWGGTNKFKTEPPRTLQGLRAKTADIEHFLESVTSTKSGIISTYKKKAETLKDRYGIDIDWKTLANYYGRKLNEKFDNKYGSKTALRAIGVIEQNIDRVKKDIEEKRHVDLQVEDDVLNEKIEEMLQYNRKALKKLGVL